MKQTRYERNPPVVVLLLLVFVLRPSLFDPPTRPSLTILKMLRVRP